jgi:hypothetical protein
MTTYYVLLRCFANFGAPVYEKLSNNAILFINFRGNCQMHFNMRHIVGFRKIISFKMGIKKYTKLIKKTKLIII